MKLLSLLIYCLPIFLFSQVSDKVKELAKPLDTINYAEDRLINLELSLSKKYLQFKKIREAASNDELYYFSLNGSNALRYYSVKELISRKDERIAKLYDYYLKNPLKMKLYYSWKDREIDLADQMSFDLSNQKFIIMMMKEKPYKSQSKSELIDREMYTSWTEKEVEKEIKIFNEIEGKSK